MNVLSLFDGLSGGQIALDRLGVKVDNYYASEIDKYAMKVAKDNYPNTKHIGSVIDLTEEQLLALGDIDLLIGGSPCQGFSFAGKQKGSSTKSGIDVTSLAQYLELKDLGFEFDGQSYLFWEYVRVWKIVKPKKFLLENVRITKKWQTMFDEAMGVEPIVINSALVSAQNRVRYYWTNIESIPQPDDRGILLKDVLDCGSNTVYQRGRGVNPGGPRDNKSPCMTTSSWQENVKVVTRPCEPRDYNEASLCHHVADATDINGHDSIKRVYADSGKAPTLTTMQGGHRQPKVLVNESMTKKGKSYTLTASYGGAVAWNSCQRKQRTMVATNESDSVEPNVYNGLRYRKLTPVECERLQTVPEGYTDCVSNSQRYKMLGNGWTIEVIEHILGGLN